jgi:hypothetical protein
MHARVTRFELTPEGIDKGITGMKEQVIPRVKELSGFKGGYWLLDRKTGTGFGLALFENEAALNKSEDAAAQVREKAAQTTGAKITGVERYEVIAEVPVEELTRA